MQAEQDLTRVVRSWLHEDEHESADQVLAAVLAALDTTAQRRARWPAWNLPGTWTAARLVGTAALVLVVAFVGLYLLPREYGGFGGLGPSPSPSPSPSVTDAFDVRVLEPGIPYTVTRETLRFTITAPAPGWRPDPVTGFYMGKSAGGSGATAGLADAAFFFWTAAPDGVYTDPCAGVQGPRSDSIVELATAVAAIPGVEVVSGPKAVEVGGYPAQQVVLRIPEEIGCSPSDFKLWYDDDVGGRYPSHTGDTIRVWIVDIDGRRVWIDGETVEGAPPELAQEMQQIIDSIRFE